VIAIVIFAVFRGLFAFLQSYWLSATPSQLLSHAHDLFSKVQNLSFSYHDKNQTGS